MARLPKIPRTPAEKAKWRERRAGGQKPTRRGEFVDRLKRNILGDDVVDSYIEIKRKTTTRVSRSPAINPISNSTDITLPSIIVPKVERPDPRADVSTLVKQMDSLLRVAQSIGALSLEQQNLIIKQIKQAKAVTKEAQLEAGIGNEPQAEMVQGDEDTADNLKPLDSVMDKLTNTVNQLIDTINEKMKSKCDCESVGLPPAMGGMGMGSVGLPAPIAQKALPGSSGLQAQSQRGDFRRDPNDRRSRMMRWGQQRRAGGQNPSIMGEFGRRFRERVIGPGYEAERNAIQKVKRTQARNMAGMGNPRPPAGGAAAGGRSLVPVSTPIAGLMNSGVKKATPNPLQAINESAVRKVASPIIAKALGGTALKSIPVVGAAVGGLMAVDRLVEGDVVGAGLDLASGLGGPLTAVPALVASVSRDVYSNVFGMPPEQDPAFGPKMGLIGSIVKDLVKDAVAPKIDPQPKTAKPQDALIPRPSTPTRTRATPISATPASPSPAPTARLSPPGGGGGGGGGGTVRPTTPTGGGGGSSGGAGAARAGNQGGSIPPAATEPQAAAPPEATPPPEPKQAEVAPEQAPMTPPPAPSLTDVAVPKVTTGPAINAASLANEVEARSPVVTMPPVTPPTATAPATNITTKSGAKGMGNVPEVGYAGIRDFAHKLYFTAAV